MSTGKNGNEPAPGKGPVVGKKIGQKIGQKNGKFPAFVEQWVSGVIGFCVEKVLGICRKKEALERRSENVPEYRILVNVRQRGLPIRFRLFVGIEMRPGARA